MMSFGPEYRKLWMGSAISNLGDGVTFIAGPLLAATITHNPLLIAGLSFSYTVPRLLVAVISSAVVDRMDRRFLLYSTNFGRAACMGVLSVAVSAGFATMSLLYAVFVALGLLETVADNTGFAVLPSIVPKEYLDKANRQLTAAQLVADEFVGPPLGGFLFGVAAALPILLDAASFAAAALSFFGLRGNFRTHLAARQAQSSIRRDIIEGGRWLAQHRLLRSLSIMSALTNLCYMIPFSILVLFARDVLHLSDTGYGLVLAGSAVDGLAGSVIAGKARRKLGRGWTISGSLLVGAASYLVIALTSSAILVGFMLALYIFHSVVWSLTVTSLRQVLVPDELCGRISGVNKLLALVGLSLRSLLGGVLAARFGLAAPFVGSWGVAGCDGIGLSAVHQQSDDRRSLYGYQSVRQTSENSPRSSRDSIPCRRL